eukprot:superscaffoldBa00010582_g24784
MGVHIAHRLGHSAVFSQPDGPDSRLSIPKLLLPPEDSAETSDTEKKTPALISVFLPEFPHRTFPGQEHFQILGFIAKGSFGPIVKVKDVLKEKIYAVKVLPKSEILKRGALEQSKEEVIIQRQLKHPYIHNLQECWQTKRHLFITPEVLSGGPYNHAADWWSLGIMLFSLVTGEFPVPAEPDHSTMLSKVRQFPYVLPQTFSSALILLLTELLCKNPVNRLRNLDCYKMQAFFRGTSFDSQILQKTPVGFILELRTHPDWTAKATRGISLEYFDNFDCDKILHSPTTPSELSPTLATMDLN